MIATLRSHSRLLSIVGVYVGAPVCAEYLQAYLSLTGNPLRLLAGLLVLSPLYGGAALLIREVAVRAGRGWRGVLLLAAAFGVAMPGVIDLALRGEHRADTPYWEELRSPTLIEPLGIAVQPTLGWIAGHVLMSVGAPLALQHALVPRHRGRPLLSRAGLAVVTVVGIIAAVFAHADGRRTYDYAPGLGQVAGISLVVLVLILAAFSPCGRPLPARGPGRLVAPQAILLGGLAGKLVIDLVPPTWAGAAGQAAVLLAGFVGIGWFAANRRWGAREIGLLGSAAIMAGTFVGFLVPPPEGGAVAAKYAQSVVLLVLAIGFTVWVYRATAHEALPAARDGTPNNRRQG